MHLDSILEYDSFVAAVVIVVVGGDNPTGEEGVWGRSAGAWTASGSSHPSRSHRYWMMMSQSPNKCKSKPLDMVLGGRTSSRLTRTCVGATRIYPRGGEGGGNMI